MEAIEYVVLLTTMVVIALCATIVAVWAIMEMGKKDQVVKILIKKLVEARTENRLAWALRKAKK